ncbi:fibronectin type III domain-containing protein, partial [Actinoplanes philippinensis]
APPVTPPRPVTPVAPDAPGIGAATAGDESALVRWTTPLHDGGTPIYGYEIQALDAETGIVVGVDVADAGTTELTLTGLTNGVGYAFWVRAVNAAGASAFSGISNTVTPAVPAGPGTGNPGTGPGTGNPGTDPGTGNPGTDPGTGNPGTGPGTGNPGTGNPGSTVPATPTPTVSVTPTGSPAPTGSVTPRPTGSPTATPSPTGSTSPTPGDPGSTPDARTVPGAARIGTPAPAAAAVVVRWTAPADNGGSPIQRYEIQVLTGNGRQVGDLRTAPAGAAVQTVNGLADGTLYRFRVRAVNALGAGSWSATSTTVTPRTVPGKVRTLTAKPGAKGGKLTTTVRWTAPATTGGSKITGYRITWQRLNAKGTARGTALVTTVAAGARTASFTAPGDVPANTRYRVTVQAVNGAGAAPGSAVTTTIR